MRSVSRSWWMVVVAALVVGAVATAPASAAEKAAEKAKVAKEMKAKPTMAKPTTAKQEMLNWMSDAESKLNELAEATPEEKYTWRPGEGVRSTGEVFLHVAAANFGIPSFFGVTPPEGFKFDGFEQSLTTKADIQKALKDSFVHVKKAVEGASEADLNKMVSLFGNEMTERSAFMLIMSHQHEHLGQSIAYARVNGIVPPWTAREQAEKEKQKAAGGN